MQDSVLFNQPNDVIIIFTFWHNIYYCITQTCRLYQFTDLVHTTALFATPNKSLITLTIETALFVETHSIDVAVVSWIHWITFVNINTSLTISLVTRVTDTHRNAILANTRGVFSTLIVTKTRIKHYNDGGEIKCCISDRQLVQLKSSHNGYHFTSP